MTNYLVLPEVLRELPNYLVVPAELWSVGVIFLECLTGTQPFDGCKSRRDLQAKQVKLLDGIKSLHQRSQRILSCLLTLSPKERISTTKLCELIDELFPPTDQGTPRSRSSDRFYTISRAKTFHDLRDLKSSGGSARCPLPPTIDRSPLR